MPRFTISLPQTQALANAFFDVAKKRQASQPLTCSAAIALWMGLNARAVDQQAFVSHVVAGSDALMNILEPHGPDTQTSPHFADRWQYTGGDSCCQFFTACLKAARYDLRPGARVLEVGCAEYDWMGEMLRQCPDIHVTGIDWRRTARGIQGDVLTYNFPPDYFDACVAISSLEHIGLGHYDHDPIDPCGDMKALARIWRSLKSGGIVYFDVPYRPDHFAVKGTSHREYNDLAIMSRLHACERWRELWRGWCHPSHCDVLLPERPTVPLADGAFYYVGMVWQKP